MYGDDQLNVWHGNIHVGTLWRDTIGLIGFQYTEQWCEQGFPISQQLPITTDEFAPASSTAHHFFANLLPEADARTHIVRDLKISNSDYELLKAIGGECAGALSILPLSQEPTEKKDYKKLSQDDLDRMILKKGYLFKTTSPNEYPRLSLAGAQDKCPVYFDGQDYFLPLG